MNQSFVSSTEDLSQGHVLHCDSCQAGCEHGKQNAHRTQSVTASKPVTIYTGLTFRCRHLFCHCQPCEAHTVNSAVTSFRFAEIDSLTSLTLGKGEREKQPPGSGKVKAALGRHGLRLPETCTKLVS